MKKFLPGRVWQKFLLSFLLLVSILLGSNQGARAQNKHAAPPVVQSTFYDALALYYTVIGYKAYPEKLNDLAGSFYMGSENASPDGSNATSTQNNNTPTHANPLLGGTGGNSTAANDKKIDTTKNTDKKSPANNSQHYRLFECATGKILLDTVGELKGILQKFKFDGSESDLQKSIVDSILYRNLTTASEADSTHELIVKHYDGNAYLKDFLNPANRNAFFGTAKEEDMINGVDQGPPFTLAGGGLSVNSVIEGYTDFLIERVNEEFNDAFLVHLYKALDRIPEFAILFPNTLASLYQIQITNYSASLNTIKSAYETDIRYILSNIGQLATLPKYQKLINKYHYLTVLFASADLLEGIKDKTKPAEIIYQLGKAPYTQLTNDYSSAIKLAALLSNSVRDIRQGDETPEIEGWLGKDKLASLRDKSLIFKVFMGLFTQNAGGITFGDANPVDFQSLLNKNIDKVLAGRYIVFNFYQSSQKIETIVSALKGTEGKTLQASDYVKGFIDLSTELLGLSNKCLGVLPNSTEIVKLRAVVKKCNDDFLPMIKVADTVLIHIEAKDYSMAVNSAGQLLKQIIDYARQQNNHSIDSSKKALDSLNKIAGDHTNEKKNLSKAIEGFNNDNDSLQKLHTGFIDYGQFIASIAVAKNSADVKAAINAFALPTGSSRIKKERRFTISLNAYVGVYHAWNKSYPGLSLPASEWGITAPLGVGFNFGINKFLFMKHFSLSAYGGIIDIGAIFTYKARGDTLQSSIELGQIFSPSAGVIFGIPLISKYNFPISIGANVQWGPKLKSVTQTGNSVLPLLVRRFNVFLAFDLPIRNFYTSREPTTYQ